MTTTTIPKYLSTNDAELWLIVPNFTDILLLGENAYGDSWFELAAMADGNVSWGSPQPIDTAVERWKTDGAIAATQGHANREITFLLRVRGKSSADLAAAEAALALRSAQPCVLRWTPPEGVPDAVSTDFEVWTWHLAPAAPDLDAELRLTRYYQVTMTADPWACSSTTVTVDAVTTPGTPLGLTEVDTCASVSGWGGSPNAPTSSGGSVRETVGVAFFSHGRANPSLTRIASITGLDVQPYLALTMSVSGGTAAAWHVYVDNIEIFKVGQVGTTSYWQMPAGKTSLGLLKILAEIIPQSLSVQLAVADVSKTDTVGGIGSRKQLTRSIAVPGSVKTAGSIKVASPSGTGLGTVLVYTQPDNGLGFNPGLRQYRTAGNTQSAQSTAVSGFRESLTASAITFTIPANVVPEASYAVVARVYASAAGDTLIGGSIGTGTVLAGATLAGKVTWPAAGYQWVILGVVTFPLLSLPPESQVASVVQLAAVGGTGVALDEAYLLDITHGDYTLINADTATRLWLDAPDADRTKNRPQIYLGTLDDRSDAVGANTTDIAAQVGRHDLYPGGTVVSTVTDGVDNALVSATFFPRWHTHAAA